MVDSYEVLRMSLFALPTIILTPQHPFPCFTHCGVLLNILVFLCTVCITRAVPGHHIGYDLMICTPYMPLFGRLAPAYALCSLHILSAARSMPHQKVNELLDGHYARFSVRSDMHTCVF